MRRAVIAVSDERQIKKIISIINTASKGNKLVLGMLMGYKMDTLKYYFDRYPCCNLKAWVKTDPTGEHKFVYIHHDCFTTVQYLLTDAKCSGLENIIFSELVFGEGIHDEIDFNLVGPACTGGTYRSKIVPYTAEAKSKFRGELSDLEAEKFFTKEYIDSFAEFVCKNAK